MPSLHLNLVTLCQVSLELGGKSPQIIFDTADLDQGEYRLLHLTFTNSAEHQTAANWVALGILYNTGQDCTAGSRLFVQDTIYDKFIPVCILHQVLHVICVNMTMTDVGREVQAVEDW